MEKEFHNVLDQSPKGECTPEERHLVEELYQKNQKKPESLNGWDGEQRNVDPEQHGCVSLNPGQQASYSGQEQQVTPKDFDLGHYLDWKEGIIRFDGMPLSQAFERLERWFNLVIVPGPEVVVGNCYPDGHHHNEPLINIPGIGNLSMACNTNSKRQSNSSPNPNAHCAYVENKIGE